MADPTTERDPYKVLQVDPEADLEIIQAAYRRLAQRHHPDVAPDVESAARMAELNAAWERLRDPARRAAVDRERATRARQTAAAERERLLRHLDRDGTASQPAPPRPPAAAVRRPAEPGARQPEQVSRDWTSGRSSVGGGYDPDSMRRAEGLGAAGPPPGDASGSVLTFGRYAGWSLGEIARRDADFLEWLDRTPIGRPYRDEIDAILRRLGRRRSADPDRAGRRGLFRRR